MKRMLRFRSAIATRKYSFIGGPPPKRLVAVTRLPFPVAPENSIRWSRGMPVRLRQEFQALPWRAPKRCTEPRTRPC
jgi:hypothetical protein